MVMPTVSGRDRLASIEEALQETSSQVDRLNAEVSDANAEKAKLIAERLDAFKALAEFRAKLAVVDGVIDEADRLSTQVRAILDARQKTVTGLEQREKQATDERDKILAGQTKLGKEIEALESRLDALGDAARKALSSQPGYSEHSKSYQELESTVANATAKADKAKAEEAEKGKPYRDDPIFMYLWERHFGTSEYEPTGVVRSLDRWVAGLTGYTDARANFSMLTAIPQRLAEHVARLTEKLKTEREALDAIEAEKIHQLAGADLVSELRSAHGRREEETAKLTALNAELVETGKQLKHYAEGLDPAFHEAVEKTSEFLQSQGVNTLLVDARRTPEVDDDRIVGTIVKFADELGELEREMKSKRETLDRAFARKEELLRLAAEFRRSRYDAPGSVFDQPSGGGGEAWLRMLLEGAISAAEYWSRTQRSQRWEGRSADSYRRSEHFPSNGGGSRGGSSGPDFRTGGGF